MAKNDDLNFNSEEYKFAEEQHENKTDSYDKEENFDDKTFSSSAALPRAFGRMRNKRLLIPVLLIVVVTVFYQLGSWISGSKTRSDEQKARQNHSIVAPLPPLAQSPGVVTSNANVMAPIQDVSVQQKLDILATRTASNVDELQKLQTTLTQNQSDIASLNHAINGLSDSMQTLSDNVKKLVAAQTKPKKVVKKVKKDVPPRDIYHVKAIVPGMAWLESASGKTVTVRVGDSLTGYGNVRFISPKSGMVITSNGAIIQYGVNDF